MVTLVGVKKGKRKGREGERERERGGERLGMEEGKYRREDKEGIKTKDREREQI